MSLQIRVPQQQLETVMAQIADLGEVRRSSITAEDVSNQLVDLQARLVNLRQTEASLLEIMERSGSVSEVLEVAQELSQTREQIERIDAQLQSLQTRVAYSTITISIEASVSTAEPDGIPLGFQLKDTWRDASQSFASFTIGVIKFLIWLLVYSPYLLAIAVIVWLIRRFSGGKRLQHLKTAIASANPLADHTNTSNPSNASQATNQNHIDRDKAKINSEVDPELNHTDEQTDEQTGDRPENVGEVKNEKRSPDSSMINDD